MTCRTSLATLKSHHNLQSLPLLSSPGYPMFKQASPRSNVRLYLGFDHFDHFDRFATFSMIGKNADQSILFVVPGPGPPILADMQ
jgi:hypothetical protein